jgi:hypothetical protein
VVRLAARALSVSLGLITAGAVGNWMESFWVIDGVSAEFKHLPGAYTEPEAKKPVGFRCPALNSFVGRERLEQSIHGYLLPMLAHPFDKWDRRRVLDDNQDARTGDIGRAF